MKAILRQKTPSLRLGVLYQFMRFLFYHPAFTVGFGISPNQQTTNHVARSRTLTAGREFHPAPKKLSYYVIFYVSVAEDVPPVNVSYKIIDRPIRFFGMSTLRTFTSTISPTLTTSNGCFTNFLLLNWEI